MTVKTISELDIWTRVVVPAEGTMQPEDAHAILRWEFDESAKQRMNHLADRNNRGELTENEREELEHYVHVGQVVAILHAKARLALRQTGQAGSNGET